MLDNKEVNLRYKELKIILFINDVAFSFFATFFLFVNNSKIVDNDITNFVKR